jgi:hypothetical protein
MNSGWRYQSIALKCAHASKRFKPVADAGIKEITDAFGEQCRRHGLLDSKGKFNDSKKLVHLFCSA